MNPGIAPLVSIFISSFALAVSIAVAIFTFFRLRYYISQAKFSSLLEVIRANREIVTVGLRDPDLFSIVSGTAYSDTEFDLVFNCKNNSYMLCSWAGGDEYAQELPYSSLF